MDIIKEDVKRDLLAVLRDGSQFLQRNQFAELKQLSNHVIHNASIFQDEDSLSLAVVIYSLSKIAERGNRLDPSVHGLMIDAIHDLEENDHHGYKSRIKALLRKVAQADSKLQNYIEEVIRMGRIRKGNKIYDHGISLAQASELLGISQWELASYAGRQESVEHSTPEQTRARIELARQLFKVR